MNRDVIEQFAHGGEKVAMSIRGLTRENLLAAPPSDADAGKWSIQQVVLHLADSEQVYADRIKRVIVEENPTLLAFDQNKWSAALHYEDQSAEDAAKLIDLTRKQLAAVLRKLGDKDFNRSGTHSESGKKTLADLVTGATNHLEHHLKFIHAKRAKMGKEMW